MNRRNGEAALELPDYYWPTVERIAGSLVVGKEVDEHYFHGVPAPGRRNAWIDTHGIFRSLIKFDTPPALSFFPNFQLIKILMGPGSEPGQIGEKYYYFPEQQNVLRLETYIPGGELSDEEVQAIHDSEIEHIINKDVDADETQCLGLLLELSTGLLGPEYISEA